MLTFMYFKIRIFSTSKGTLEFRKSSLSNLSFFFFNIFCWLWILSQILACNYLDAFFHVFIYLSHLSTCFEHQVFIVRRSNFINTSSGMITLCKWLLGMPVRSSLLTGIPSSHLHRLIIPDDVLIQFDLLMISTRCSKHVERWDR